MASVYILPIDDDVASPALELLRRIVQPTSRSLPHITVRYSNTEAYLPEGRLYGDFVADEVVLLEPSTFDSEGSQGREVSTVFFRCLSDQLEYLQYKPDFPQSVFHISVYDGEPSGDAATVLKVMRDYPWHLRIALPKTRLTRGSHKLEPGPAIMSKRASTLLASLGFEPSVVSSSSAPTREALVGAICDFLHRNLPRAAHRHPATIDSRDDVYGNGHPEQGAFWSRLELMDDRTRDRIIATDRLRLRGSGSFMTPPEVAYDIVKATSRLLDGQDVKFGDPSSGGGIFLAALLRQIGSQRIARATLVEADHTSAALAADRWAHLGYAIAVDDFVTRMLSFPQPDNQSEGEGHWFDERPDLIITNPPYVRSQALSDAAVAQWRDSIMQTLGLRVDVRTDLYVYFVLAAHSWMAEGGIGVWLLPSEFMFTRYGASLRTYLTTQVTLLKVHMYDGPSVFANARVSSCAVFYAKRRAPSTALAEFSVGGSIERPNASRSVTLRALAGAEKWHKVADEGVLVSTGGPNANASTLGHWFEVRRGIATGANGYFIVDDAMARSFGPGAAEWLKPVLPKARQLVGPVVEADGDGLPMVRDLRWLIDTDVSLGRIDELAPSLADYLRSIEPIVMKRTLVARRRPFYRQERNRPPRFFFSYMSREMAPARRFYLNRSRAVALNNYLVLHPRPTLLQWMSAADGRDSQILTALRELDGAAMERSGRVYVEGLTKVEPRELASMRLELSIAGLNASSI